MVLSDKTASHNLAVLDKLDLKEYKTKAFKIIVDNLMKKGTSLKAVKGDKKTDS